MSYLDCMILRQLITRKEPEKIIEVLSRITGISKEEMKGTGRQRYVVAARDIAMLLMSEYFPHLTLNQIGRQLGSRDHSTVIHSREKLRNSLKLNDEFSRDIQRTYKQAKKVLDNNFYFAV